MIENDKPNYSLFYDNVHLSINGGKLFGTNIQMKLLQALRLTRPANTKTQSDNSDNNSDSVILVSSEDMGMQNCTEGRISGGRENHQVRQNPNHQRNQFYTRTNDNYNGNNIYMNNNYRVDNNYKGNSKYMNNNYMNNNNYTNKFNYRVRNNTNRQNFRDNVYIPVPRWMINNQMYYTYIETLYTVILFIIVGYLLLLTQFTHIKWVTFPERLIYHKSIQMYKTVCGDAPDQLKNDFVFFTSEIHSVYLFTLST